MSEIANEFEALKEARTKMGLSQKKIAPLIGYRGQQSYSRAENNSTRFTEDRLKELLKYFDITTTIEIKPKQELLEKLKDFQEK